MTGPTVFDEDDSMMVMSAAIADITDTADATYSGNEQTMLDNLKARTNSILAALRKANIIAED